MALKSLQGRGQIFDWLSSPKPGHLVQFYNTDSQLLHNLGDFIGIGLLKNESCVVIATPSHIQSLCSQLKDDGMEVSKLKASGQLVLLDAKETLKKFMVNDVPDRKRFFKVIGELVDGTARKGKPLRAYGEMVALLWQAGNEKAVIQLEELWNELGKIHSFSLYCAYPEIHFIIDSEVKDKINHRHNVQFPSLATG